MEAKTLTKGQKRELRRLAGIAYEREQTAAVSALEQQFQRWHAGEIDVFTLNEEIHKYHNGIQRELYKRYAMGDPDIGVASAVAHGFLKQTEITPEIMAYIGGMVGLFQESSEGEESAAADK